jgi:DNA-binding CsgD family transcriptional regulator
LKWPVQGGIGRSVPGPVRPSDAVEGDEIGLIELDLDRGHVLFKVLDRARPRDQQHPVVSSQQPAQRDLRPCGPVLARDRAMTGSLASRAVAVEAALAAGEPDRLIFRFAMAGAAELLDALPRHETAHAALLADVVDVLRGSAPSSDRERRSEVVELSPTELRVLRDLPTNLTRAEIAQELYVSVNTVNTRIRSVYLKLDARDRSSAVQHAGELRLLSSGRS